MRDKARKNNIFSTKLMPPTVSGALTVRPRLLALTSDILVARLTAVRTPAGFGKSTLLLQWREKLQSEGVPTAWVSLDERDTDPANILAQIILAISRVASVISTATLTLAQEFSLCETNVLMSQLIGDISMQDAPICLMLDDVHTINAEAARSVLAILVDRAPPNLKLVLATREVSWIPMGRMRAFGQLFELTADDLRFGTEECADFLTNDGILGAQRAALEEIASKVEGWVVGLKLAIMAVRAAPNQLEQIINLSGSHEGIADFFKEEVLEKQSPEYFEFLIQTSILHRMCAALCDAVTLRSDSQDMLNRIAHEGLFIFSLDTERTWFRYHRLFGDFLLAEARRRDSERIKLLHARASAWYEKQGLYAEAFDHLVQSGDFENAAALFASVCEDMFGRGEIAALFEWASRLPPETIAQYPIIDLTVAWWLTVEWRFSEAEQLLQRVEARIRQMRPGAPDVRKLTLDVVHRRANINLLQERLNDSNRIISDLTAEYYDAAPYIRATFPLMSIHDKMASLKLTGITRLVEESYREFQAAAAPFSLIWHGAVSGAAFLLAGEIGESLGILRRSISLAERFHGVTELRSMPAICLAHVLYEQNEITEAKLLVDMHFDTISYRGFVHQLVSGYTVNIRLALLGGDWAQAERIIEQGLALASGRNFERFRLHMISEKVRLLAMCGREDELQRHIRTVGVYDDDAPRLPNASCEPTNTTEIRALTWVRAARHLGKVSEALKLSRRWRDFSLHHGAVMSELQWRVTLADLLLLDGDSLQAGRELSQAVLIAAPRGLMRCFLDADAPVIERLRILAPTFESNIATRGFWRDLSKAFPNPENDNSRIDTYNLEQNCPLIESFTHRELEILQYVSRGYLNAEIAGHLCLAEGSIKWYLHRVFEKLGVRKRRQAVERAQALGLI